MIFKRTSGILIPKTEEFEYARDIAMRRLTRASFQYQNSPAVTYKFYVDGDRFLKIPRYFPIDEYIPGSSIETKIPEGKDIEINSNITLRDTMQKSITDYMLTHDNGIIQAPPGSGKTVTTIFVICKLQMKTFILVHRDTLVDQWIGPGTESSPQGFLTYTDINPNNITRLTSKNFKEDLQKDIVVSTDQTFISLLKRHRGEFLVSLNEANFGIFIGDEVHTTVGAPSFSECSIHMPVRKTFGLSATPERADGNTDIIEFHLGPVFVPEGEDSTMEARVNIMLFNFGVDEGKTKVYIHWGGQFQRSRYLNLMKKSKILMDISKALLQKCYKDKRNIIYLCERIKMIEILYNWFPEKDKSMFTGSAKNNVLEKQLSFATPGKIRDGVDAVDKNCLIITSPISNIEQLCGRVVRPKEGKEEPFVIDMVDTGCNEIARTLSTRVKYYEKKKWNIKYLQVMSNGTKREVTKEEVFDFIYPKEEKNENQI